MKKTLILFIAFLFLIVNISLAQSAKHQIQQTLSVKSEFTRQLQCLTENIYNESAHEPYEGKLAVGTVTMNRAQSRKFPSDICAVVHQKTGSICQFSWYCDGGHKVRDPYEWQQAQIIARSMLTGQLKHDKLHAEKALYFHATYVAPLWAKQKALVKKIGGHLFYRERQT